MAVLVFYGESLYFKDSHNKLTNETEATIRRLLLENNGVCILKIKNKKAIVPSLPVRKSSSTYYHYDSTSKGVR